MARLIFDRFSLFLRSTALHCDCASKISLATNGQVELNALNLSGQKNSWAPEKVEKARMTSTSICCLVSERLLVWLPPCRFFRLRQTEP